MSKITFEELYNQYLEVNKEYITLSSSEVNPKYLSYLTSFMKLNSLNIFKDDPEQYLAIGRTPVIYASST